MLGFGLPGSAIPGRVYTKMAAAVAEQQQHDEGPDDDGDGGGTVTVIGISVVRESNKTTLVDMLDRRLTVVQQLDLVLSGGDGAGTGDDDGGGGGGQQRPEEDPDEDGEEGSISSVDSGGGGLVSSGANKRRTLRFDSAESSDSGVATLSSTDSSQSSGHSDITEPGSPPSPASSPSSGVSSPSDHHHLHHHHHHHHHLLHHHHHHHDHDDQHLEDGYDPGSDPPSCQGSYDSGLEEGAVASLPSSEEGSLPSSPPSGEEDGSVSEDGVVAGAEIGGVAVVGAGGDVEQTHEPAAAGHRSVDGDGHECDGFREEDVSDSCRLAAGRGAPDVVSVAGPALAVAPAVRPCSPPPQSTNTNLGNLYQQQQTIRSGEEPATVAGAGEMCCGTTTTTSSSFSSSTTTSTNKNGAPLQLFFSVPDAPTLPREVIPALVAPLPFTASSLVPRPLPGKVGTPAGTSSELTCRWAECRRTLPHGGNMIEHIRGSHVDAQVNAESFVCLWEGCKVFNRASCSLSWLERHVLAHSGHKPFRCIVDGCGQRFTSQGGLERHVNSHFSGPTSGTSGLSSASLASSGMAGYGAGGSGMAGGVASSSSAGGGQGGMGFAGGSGGAHKRLAGRDDTPTKIMKKRKLKLRRASWTARKEDFFDAGIMECLRHRLITFNNHTKLGFEGSGSSITFHSTVIARRVDLCGKVTVLLRWAPENVIPDEWVCESQTLSRAKQTIPLASLPRDALLAVESLAVPASRPYRKNRRK